MSLKTLRDDIYKVLCDGAFVSGEDTREFGYKLSNIVSERLARPNQEPRLRLSNLGTKCRRKLWYQLAHPELGEPLSPATRLKFLFGDIIEALVMFLARVSGHEVTDEQKEVNLHGITGHIDGLVDGKLVDVKSASTPSFQKFERGLQSSDDDFGYLTQLGSYSQSMDSGGAAFIAVDKQHGHITVDEHTFTEEITPEYVHELKAVLASPVVPNRGYSDEKQSDTSPNRKLGVACSYCAFKKECWPGLRTFIYGAPGREKPVFLTRVLYEPRVQEVE